MSEAMRRHKLANGKGPEAELARAELKVEILRQLGAGRGLFAICKDKGMPERPTVLNWLSDDEKFRKDYATAREAGLDAMAEEIIDLSDDARGDIDEDGRPNHAAVNRSRLQVDARKWIMSKIAPKKYGDRVGMELAGDGGGALNIVVTTVGGKKVDLGNGKNDERK